MLTFFSTLLFSLMSLLMNDTATLVFAGDAMQHEGQLNAARRSDGSYNYDDYFKAIKPYVESADYAVVNLETPIAGAPYSGYPMFNAPASYVKALTDAGFDFMLAANNHTLDRRDRGVVATIEEFERQGVPFAGIYRNAAERAKKGPVIVDAGGFKVAILNYTYGTNGITIQGDVVVDYIDRKVIAADIAAARKAGAEVIAACMHWGDEYHLLPNETQKRLADFLIEQGVELVIGGHPHVIQPMERRGDDRLVVYSLGNFISAMKKTDTVGGAMVRVTLRRGADGKPKIEDASYRLVYVESPASSGGNYRLVPVETPPAGAAGAQCRAFTKSATDIFDRHNVRVRRDDGAMSNYVR